MSNKLGLIYGICHKKTNRWYIGQTTRGLECRWGEHLKEMTYSNRHLYCAMRKYGLDEFQIEILEDNIPTEQLDSKSATTLRSMTLTALVLIIPQAVAVSMAIRILKKLKLRFRGRYLQILIDGTLKNEQSE